MADDNGLGFVDLLRDAPMRTLVFTVVPIGLAVAQLLNGFFTDLPMWAAGAFAVVMLASAVSLAQHHRAELRLERLEREIRPQRAD